MNLKIYQVDRQKDEKDVKFSSYEETMKNPLYSKGLYSTNNTTKTISANSWQSTIAAWNGMVLKNWYDLSTLYSGGEALKYYNRTFSTNYDLSQSVCGNSIRYLTSNNGGGIVSAHGNEYVLTSSTSSSFRVPATLNIVSLQKGYYDSTNSWVNQGTVSYSTIGSEYGFSIDAYECIRLVYTNNPRQNIALQSFATVTSGSTTTEQSSLIDGNIISSYYQSETSPSFPKYITLTWDNEQSFDTIILQSAYGQGQGVTSFDVEVSSDGINNWTQVATKSNIAYSYNNSTIESILVNFSKVSNTKGVRLKINSANNSWNHFVVYEIEIPITNLAITAETTASSISQENPISNINDGDLESAYQSNDNIQLPQYLYFKWNDGGKDFDRIQIYTYYSQGQGPIDYNIQVSSDGETNWTSVTSMNDISYVYNSATIEIKTITFEPVTDMKGLRIRIDDSNLTWNHFAINEVRILNEINLASNSNISATTYSSNNPASNLIDGDERWGWQSADNPSFTQSVTLVWDEVQEFNCVNLMTIYSQGQAPTSYDIQVSTDGSTNWTTVASVSNLAYLYNNATIETKTVLFTRVSNKKGLRIVINNANMQWSHFAIMELEVTNN